MSDSSSNPDLLQLLDHHRHHQEANNNTQDIPKHDTEEEDEENVLDRHCSRLSLSPTSVTTPAPDDVILPLVLLRMEEQQQQDNEAITNTTTSTTTQPAWPLLPASHKSLRTTNPIRAIVDPVLASVNADTLSLALGDPTAYLEPCPVAVKAVRDAIASQSHCCAGYVNACGTDAARRAVASHPHYSCSSNTTSTTTLPDQVIVANGCSGALELALTALLDSEETSILLIPQPGFPLYQVIAESHGAQVRHYRLLPHQNWEIDLDHVREILQEYHGTITANVVRGLVVNNPANPTGAVYSRQHLRDICALCDEYQIPIVADEVYGDLVLDGHTFHPMARVADELGRRVPVITASGIGKQYLLPGWRVGWIVFHDNIYGSLQAIHAGAQRLAQVVLGASHLAQAAVPALLDPSNAPAVHEWQTRLRRQLQQQAETLTTRLSAIPGLECGPAQGALYLMVRLRKDVDDVEFCQRLLQEQNVLVLPGQCFGAPHYVRMVFCAPVSVLEEAADRIQMFCQKYYQPTEESGGPPAGTLVDE